MSKLTRTRVGEFKIEDEGKLISLEELLENNPSRNLEDNEYKNLSNGIMLDFEGKANNESNLNCFVKLYYNEEFVGVGKIENNNKIQRFILNDNEKGEE